MKKFHTLLFYFFILSFSVTAQTTLVADGPGNTYQLITDVLAPNYNPIEAPDCSHTGFGEHIEEVWDSTLGKYVFAFHLHVNEDDDRCINLDRQRNEIKSYDKSPDDLLGVIGETVVYKWKFKLPLGFQPSGSFTHIHQTKAVGGSESSHPQITLTVRDASTDRVELRYAPNNSSSIIGTADLSLFLGEWMDVTQTIVYGDGLNGYYELSVVRMSDGMTVLEYLDPAIRMWKTGADFIRPKWGIYRSLNDPSALRDETVYFADFSIQEFACPPNYIANGYGALLGTENTMMEYETDGAIESTQVILSGADVDYDSNKHIDLFPGFETHLNAFFHAYIDGCN